MRVNTKICNEKLSTVTDISAFQTEDGLAECHIIIHVAPRLDSFQGQMERLDMMWKVLMSTEMMQGMIPVAKRYYLSDVANQSSMIPVDDACTTSFIQQPPLDGSKVAMWVYLVGGAEVEYNADGLNSTVVSHNGVRHIWSMGMMYHANDSFDETSFLLRGYEMALNKYHKASIADNCIRTWFFVRDVDTNYSGLVDARREYFEANGLTAKTHYIASTGIGGCPGKQKALVQLSSYAATGLKKNQQQYLCALSHLNRTIEYGVTFERGTLVKYGDRSHAFISGTASIDNKGQVMHVGDVEKQTYRMWENVEELLKEAQMSFADVMQIIVYLRDIADYQLVEKLFREKFPETPYVITLAPVCRPQWLIEMECVAVSDKGYKEFKNF